MYIYITISLFQRKTSPCKRPFCRSPTLRFYRSSFWRFGYCDALSKRLCQRHVTCHVGAALSNATYPGVMWRICLDHLRTSCLRARKGIEKCQSKMVVIKKDTNSTKIHEVQRNLMSFYPYTCHWYALSKFDLQRFFVNVVGGRKHCCRCAVASAACTVAADFGGVSWVFREQKDRQGNPQGKSLRINAGVEFFVL